MAYVITQATRKIARLTKRLRVVQGGTSAGKTIGILEVLIDLAQRDTSPTLTSVVSESFPHLKRGAIRDFLSIMEEQRYFTPERWNKSDFTYTFETGSRIEFFSADQPGKVRGPRRDRLFINEANNVPFETFEQLEIRTKEFIFLDYNPVSEFWVYEHILGKRTDVDHLILTYKDNEALDQAIIQTIEARKHRKGWWQVYGLGELGEVEGRIFTGWNTAVDIPHEARLERYGLDFGYTNDPTAIVAVYWFNGGYIFDEVAFHKGLSNKQIADILLNEKRALVVADSAEPKSIAEIGSYGLNITGAQKTKREGVDFVKWGIQVVQDQQISVTKRSTNVIKEYRNYLWETDKKDGHLLPTPEHTWSHSMDAIRYAMCTLVHVIRTKELMDQMRYAPPRQQVNPGL